ncbi:MAG: aspartate carbamoyltransferase [Patescibacteria group bacterium]
MAILKHVYKSQQFTRELLEELFLQAELFERVSALGNINHFPNKTMAALFYEPSTRTRLSFEAAMIRLGGKVIGTESARKFSSALKGESLEDTIRVVENYADVIVLRHDKEGGAERAAKVSKVPVINAGDGSGQHPTQALLDLYTVRRELGGIDGVTAALVGDLAKGRAVRSLAYLLSKYAVAKIYFVAPPSAQIAPDILAHLGEHGIAYELTDDLGAIVPLVDIIYQTRIQKERYTDADELARVQRGCYIITSATLAAMRPNAIILHPLPRNDEIATEVDSDPRAAYFRQARNGLFVRMALLSMVLS